MTTDLFYPIRPGSYWNHWDLRASLRSVEKNYPDAGEVYIVGPDLPKFLDPAKVIHVQMQDPDTSPMVNVRKKLQHVVSGFTISQKFLLMNDDFYFIDQCAELPTYHMGTLHHAMENHCARLGYWYTAMDVTRTYLMKMFQGEPLNYEVHAPMMLDADLVENVLQDFPNDRHLYFRSVYGNRYLIGGQQIDTDFKIHDAAQFQALRYPVAFASTAPISIKLEVVQRWLLAMFPEPSRWEKK